MAIINGNDTIFGTLNGRQFFIDEAFEPDTAPQLPDWVPAQDDLLELIEEQLPNAGASYAIFIVGGWNSEPIYSETTSNGSVDCCICWSTRGASQKAFELDDSGNYYYVLWNVPYSGGGGVKGIELRYVLNNPQTGWYRVSTDQDDRYNLASKNGNGNSKIFTSLLLYQKAEGVTVVDNTPQTSGYEYIDMT